LRVGLQNQDVVVSQQSLSRKNRSGKPKNQREWLASELIPMGREIEMLAEP
jgi:hypothetical protein